jgi:tRNA dimethylallyltransferase
LKRKLGAYLITKKLNALNTVGYKELFNYMEGEITRETAIEEIKKNSTFCKKTIDLEPKEYRSFSGKLSKCIGRKYDLSG